MSYVISMFPNDPIIEAIGEKASLPGIPFSNLTDWEIKFGHVLQNLQFFVVGFVNPKISATWDLAVGWYYTMSALVKLAKLYGKIA